MSASSIAFDFLQSLDIRRHLSSEIIFEHKEFHFFRDSFLLLIGKFTDFFGMRDTKLGQQLFRSTDPYTIDRGKRDPDRLFVCEEMSL